MFPIKVLIPDSPQYSKEVGEFLLRELGLIPEWVRVNSCDPLPLGSLLFCYRIEDWENRLSNMPKKSVVVILSANEYYDIGRWESLNRFQSIHSALIEFLPTRVELNQGVVTIRWIFENPVEFLSRAFWGESKRAALTWLKIRSLKFRMPVFPFPVGYTNRFVQELKTLKLLDSDRGSLFSSLKLDLANPKDGISFYGQKGSYARRKMINFFSDTKQIEVNRYDTYGGFTSEPHSTAYVESIIRSRFVLCPPGNKTNWSHRYIESLLLKAIPVMTETTIQDWTCHDFYPPALQRLNRSYKKLWKILGKKNEGELSTIEDLLREHARGKIEEARNRIEIWCAESSIVS